MKLQIKSFTSGIIIGIVLSVVFSYFAIKPSLDNLKKSNNKLQNELIIKNDSIQSLRVALTITRINSQKKIVELDSKIDSILEASSKEKIKLSKEITKLKTKTLKELEDEAERVYKLAHPTTN